MLYFLDFVFFVHFVVNSQFCFDCFRRGEMNNG